MRPLLNWKQFLLLGLSDSRASIDGFTKNCTIQYNHKDFKKITKEPWTKQDGHKDFEKIPKYTWMIQDNPEDLRIICEDCKEPQTTQYNPEDSGRIWEDHEESRMIPDNPEDS